MVPVFLVTIEDKLLLLAGSVELSPYGASVLGYDRR